MRNYVLLYLLSLLYAPALMSSMIVRDVPNIHQIRECLLRNTNLSEALFTIIFAYMNEYFIRTTLNRPLVSSNHPMTPSAAAFSPDGQWLATGTYHGLVRIWDPDGIEKQSLDAHPAPIRSLAYSPDSRLLATASDDKTVGIWESKSRSKLAILQGHESHLNSIAFSPEGGHLITASDDETIRLWDVTTAQNITQFGHHTDWVCSASFNPKDGQQFVSGGNDAMVHIWDIRSKNTIHTISEHRNNVNTASFSPDGKEVVTASDDKTVGMWSAKSGNIRRRFTLSDEVRTAYFNNDGDQILIATDSKNAYIVGAAEGDWIQTLDTHAKPTHSAVFSATAQHIVTVNYDYALLWSSLYKAHQKSKIALF